MVDKLPISTGDRRITEPSSTVSFRNFVSLSYPRCFEVAHLGRFRTHITPSCSFIVSTDVLCSWNVDVCFLTVFLWWATCWPRSVFFRIIQTTTKYKKYNTFSYLTSFFLSDHQLELVDGFKHFVYSSLFGEMIQFDDHIFQMGWFNHQLGSYKVTSSGLKRPVGESFQVTLTKLVASKCLFYGWSTNPPLTYPPRNKALLRAY